MEPLRSEDKPRCWTMPGARLVATYNLAGTGILEYKTEVTYQDLSDTLDSAQIEDEKMLVQLLDTTQKEVDCQVSQLLAATRFVASVWPVPSTTRPTVPSAAGLSLLHPRCPNTPATGPWSICSKGLYHISSLPVLPRLPLRTQLHFPISTHHFLSAPLVSRDARHFCASSSRDTV